MKKIFGKVFVTMLAVMLATGTGYAWIKVTEAQNSVTRSVQVSVDEASKFAVDLLAKEIAKGLTKYMEISTNDDFMHCRKIVHGRVRVVDPDFRF